MDYCNHRCPVCEKVFTKDSDIVVCPVCGTPHHRDCYEEKMQCHFEDRHKDGFDYKTEFRAESSSESSTSSTGQTTAQSFTVCNTCGTFNVAGSKFCTGCGEALPESQPPYQPYDRHNQENSNTQTPPPQGNPPFGTVTFDPMGGLKADTDIGNGVTIGEAAKFVKTNTPFFTRLFHQINSFGRSRFSFVGFLFHGGWMLYRKMYKLGTIITAFMALMIISQLFIGTFYTDLLTRLTEATANVSIYTASNSVAVMNEFLSTLDNEELIVTGVYFFSAFAQLFIRILCAVCGNRWYYKHSIRQITKIKNNAGSKEEADTQLQTKGGVNSALATSLIISYIVLSILPSFF